MHLSMRSSIARYMLVSSIAGACAINAYAGDVSLSKGQTLEAARNILMQEGWQPYPRHVRNGQAQCFKVVDRKLDTEQTTALIGSYSCRFPEIYDCSGTGQGFCLSNYRNRAGDVLSLTTAGGEPPSATVSHWSIKPGAASKEVAATLSNENTQFCISILKLRLYYSGMEASCDLPRELSRVYAKMSADRQCDKWVDDQTLTNLTRQSIQITKKGFDQFGTAQFCQSARIIYEAHK